MIETGGSFFRDMQFGETLKQTLKKKKKTHPHSELNHSAFNQTMSDHPGSQGERIDKNDSY